MRRTIHLALLVLATGCSGTINEYLLQARKGDADEVQEAVLMIGRLLVEKEREGYTFDDGDLAALEFLQATAIDHPDPVCRMRSLHQLRRFEKIDSSDVFLGALDDEMWGVRLEAARSLTERPAPDSSHILRKRVEDENQWEVRIELLDALSRIGDRVALRTLLEVFLDETGRYRYSKIEAYDRIRALTREEYAREDVDSWQEYYDRTFGEAGGGEES